MKPRALIDFYLFIKGIKNGEYAYRGPETVQIDLTDNCNNNCIGCWCNSPLLKEKKRSAWRQLSCQVVKEFIDEIYNMGTRRIIFSGGGEPFMHPDIIDILRYAKKKRMSCQLHTNFTLADEKAAKELIDMKLDYLTVSLWAGTAATYKLTHPGKNEETFERIKNFLTLLTSLKKNKSLPYVRLHNVITSLNYHEIVQMSSLAEDLGANAVSFATIDAISGYTDSLLLSDFERSKLLELCISLKRRKNSFLFDFNEFIRKISSEEAASGNYDKNIIDTIPCYTGWLFARLNADGSVNSCLKSHRIPVGNIYEQKFSEIWNSEKQREFRRNTYRYKKEGSYFSLIGNEPNVPVGCWRSCDDFGINIRIHRKLALMSSFVNLGNHGK